MLRDEHGFEQWVTFPKRTDFYSALAFGLLAHTTRNYPEIAILIEQTFKARIRRILDTDTCYQSQFGSNRYKDPNYWIELNTVCRKLCAEVFLEPPTKLHVSGRIEKSNELIDFADVDTYCRIASYFVACVKVYENTEHGVKTVAYCDRRNGAVGLVVCLAIENEEISVLTHRNFACTLVQTGRFPFYQRWGKEEEHAPEGILPVLASIVNDLARIAHESIQQCDASQRPNFGSLKANCEVLMQTESTRGLVNFDALQAILQRVAAEVPKRGDQYSDLSAIPKQEEVKGPQQERTVSTGVNTADAHRDLRVAQTQRVDSEHCSNCSAANAVASLRCRCTLCLQCAFACVLIEQCTRCSQPLTPTDYAAIKKVRPVL